MEDRVGNSLRSFDLVFIRVEVVFLFGLVIGDVFDFIFIALGGVMIIIEEVEDFISF